MTTQRWIFLSPHLDDVILSCGGFVWALSQEGQAVDIWTIMAGFPPDENFSAFAKETHHNWGKSGIAAIHMRREEDRAASQIVGASIKHFDWLDAIYRRDSQSGEPLVTGNQDLFSKKPERSLVADIAQMLTTQPADAQFIAPLGLGNHIDHMAVRQAAKIAERTFAWYADYPYILEAFDSPIFQAEDLQKVSYRLGMDALLAWQKAVLCYRSQISDFWRDEAETRLALKNFQAGGGGRLYQKKY